MSNPTTTPTTIRHPAWERYWTARSAWEETIREGSKRHREMEEAADELKQAGEMQREHR